MLSKNTISRNQPSLPLMSAAQTTLLVYCSDKDNTYTTYTRGTPPQTVTCPQQCVRQQAHTQLRKYAVSCPQRFTRLQAPKQLRASTINCMFWSHAPASADTLTRLREKTCFSLPVCKCWHNCVQRSTRLQALTRLHAHMALGRPRRAARQPAAA